MNKVPVSIAAISLLLSVSSIAYSAPTNSKGTNNPFVELNGELVTVQGAVSSLQDQINLLVARVETLEERVGANQDAISSLQVKNDELQFLINNYGSDLVTLQAELDALIAETATLQSLVDSGDNTLQAQINTNQELITSLQLAVSELSGLQEQVDNNNLLIGMLQGSIEEINNILAMKQNLVTGFCINGEAIQQILPDGSVICASTGGGSGTLRTVYADKGFPIGANQFLFDRSYCPSGWTATGSGFITNQGVMILSSYNFGGNATQVSAFNSNNSSGFVIIRTTCAQL